MLKSRKCKSGEGESPVTMLVSKKIKMCKVVQSSSVVKHSTTISRKHGEVPKAEPTGKHHVKSSDVEKAKGEPLEDHCTTNSRRNEHRGAQARPAGKCCVKQSKDTAGRHGKAKHSERFSICSAEDQTDLAKPFRCSAQTVEKHSNTARRIEKTAKQCEFKTTSKDLTAKPKCGIAQASSDVKDAETNCAQDQGKSYGCAVLNTVPTSSTEPSTARCMLSDRNSKPGGPKCIHGLGNDLHVQKALPPAGSGPPGTKCMYSIQRDPQIQINSQLAGHGSGPKGSLRPDPHIQKTEQSTETDVLTEDYFVRPISCDLRDKLWQFQQHDLFCDVVIVTSDSIRIFVHANVLAAASPVLQAQLKKQKVHMNTKINISQPARYVQQAVHFMYKGCTQVGTVYSQTLAILKKLDVKVWQDPSDDNVTGNAAALHVDQACQTSDHSVISQDNPHILATEPTEEHSNHGMPVVSTEGVTLELACPTRKSACMEDTASESTQGETADPSMAKPVPGIADHCHIPLNYMKQAVTIDNSGSSNQRLSDLDLECDDGEELPIDMTDQLSVKETHGDDGLIDQHSYGVLIAQPTSSTDNQTHPQNRQISMRKWERRSGRKSKTATCARVRPRHQRFYVDKEKAVLSEHYALPPADEQEDILHPAINGSLSHDHLYFVRCQYCGCCTDTLLEYRWHTNQQCLIEDMQQKQLVTRCFFCMEQLDDGVSIQDHRQKHLVLLNQKCKCSHCGRLFGDQNSLEVHLGDCGPDVKKAYCCQYCGSSYDSSILLFEHKLEAHSNAKGWILTPHHEQRKRGQPYHQGLRHKHEPSHAEGLCYKCEKCMLSFRTQNMLVYHAAKVHGGGIARVLCNSEKHIKLVHLKQVNADIMYPCRYCLETMKTSKERTDHEFKKHQMNVCGVCGQRIESGEEYIEHMANHPNERIDQYLCSYCGFTTSSRTSHQQHEVSHTGVTCTICKQFFLSYGILRRHQLEVHKSHLKEKKKKTFLKLQCSHCTATFKSPGARNIHLVTHFGKTCEICGVHFSKYCAYLKHKKIHHNTSTKKRCRQCAFCGQIFSNAREFRSHGKSCKIDKIQRKTISRNNEAPFHDEPAPSEHQDGECKPVSDEVNEGDSNSV